MFEHIYFSRHLENYSVSNKDINNAPSLERHDIAKFDESSISDNIFNAHGNISVIHGAPITNERKNDLIHIQSFNYMQMDSAYYSKRKNYDSLLILYTYNGSGELKYNGKIFDLCPNSLVFIDCMEEHSFHTTKPEWEHSVLHFSGGNSRFIYQDYFQDESIIILPKVNQFQHLLEKLLQTNSQVSLYHNLEIHEQVTTLLRYILSEKEHQEKKDNMPQTITYLSQYLEHNYSKDITLDDMAEFSNLSKYHLSREFKKYTGFTPHDYMNEVRISHAKTLLSDTDIPSYKIGHLIGIPNETNFIRLFKLKTGMTPGAFRA